MCLSSLILVCLSTQESFDIYGCVIIIMFCELVLIMILLALELFPHRDKGGRPRPPLSHVGKSFSTWDKGLHMRKMRNSLCECRLIDHILIQLPLTSIEKFSFSAPEPIHPTWKKAFPRGIATPDSGGAIPLRKIRKSRFSEIWPISAIPGRKGPFLPGIAKIGRPGLAEKVLFCQGSPKSAGRD